MKNNYEKILKKAFFICFMVFSVGIYAQGKVINGTITSTDGQPIPGANIVQRGTTNGVVSDFDGNYSIQLIDGDDVLVFSFIGFQRAEVTVGNQTTINVVLEEDSQQLDEVIVVGYGTQKKSDLTGSLVRVDAEDLGSRPVNNAVEAMQGKAAGVDITTNERPGEVPDITIRGVRSLTASNSPLYVLDGIPLTSGGINNINPADIESIDVLKDASATAIFGSRGANGVVIITTKRGKAGRMTISLNSSMQLQEVVERAPNFSASEYVDYRRWAYYYVNPEVYPRGDQPTLANDLDILAGDEVALDNIRSGWVGGTWDGSRLRNTDFTDFITRTAMTTQHTLSVSGGTEKMKAYGSFGVVDNEGVIIGQNFKRYNAIVSVDLTPKDWFSFGGTINASRSIQEFGQSNSGSSAVSATGGLYDSARRIMQYGVPYDEEGNRIDFPGGDIAIKTVIDEDKYSQDQRVLLRAFASFYAQVDIGEITPVLKGLKFRTNFGPDIEDYRRGIFIDGLSVVRTGSSYASLENRQRFSYTLDNLLYYDRTFGDHTLGVTLLQSQTEFDEEGSSMNAENIPFADQKWNALNSNNVTLSGFDSNISERQLSSYMARVNYNYADKYLLTLSGRYDGASQLADGNKWDFFPSAALAWNVSKESFLENSSWINQLKLRVGVGVTGNSAIDPYSTKGGLSPLFYAQGGGTSPAVVPGVSEVDDEDYTLLANNELGWEKTTQYNVGLDFFLLGGRISGALDFYKSNTDDLLLLKAIPTVTGYDATFANIGETKSSGIDLTLSTVNVKTNGFEWTTDFNGSYQTNEIVELADGTNDDIVNEWFIGESQDVVYGYQGNGIWQEEDAAEMALFNANGHAFIAGNARPVDQNGDNRIDPDDDRVIIGSEIPKFIAGITNTFSYKGLDLSIFLYGRFDYIYNTGGEGLGGRGNHRRVDYYTPINTDAEYQRPIFTQGTGDPYDDVLGYKNGSFLKIRNISLGYAFPDKITESLGLSKLRIYAQALNPGMVFSNVDWIDLDVRRSNSLRGITTGINIEF
ncbi:TonB-dependent receptor [Muricauda sp. CAU 1633]|uniref:SusC/RagA family TonB-linked outer membrane protein n=1 Tax=Allomuricauda sp. CAU 1633 TaxID=2816036 RepID=UPI001A8CC3AE|nr:TonB-dependent receptor [Muricauda sp. CAU 1633]MBO0324072.1 TonB-dependent receptor [Muricauda sp. CAU 1633]